MTTRTPNQQILDALKTLTDEAVTTNHRMAALETEVKSTREIVEAYAAVKTVGKFIKWFGGIVLAVTAIVIGMKLGVQHFLGNLK